ncbi:cupin domain-containing protein [Streptomyces sp. B1866]|uniref:cupin domain-containing protein n=1 Tax=Streptomyces sp. B1866 TaxID=3075431 RepID=UPI0028929123|nr:cupin domain-containing protein [Streptomyces sp. B1866]MDT3399397.1 cupin domain-containing protein [Streptomyces sp. B1866]
MRDAVVSADVHAPADVYGVHAAEGHSRWACLSRRAGLHGAWEAVEWAWLPPRGVSGEHRHTRTEELYFIVSGRGEITLDGRPYPVRAADVVLTGLGTRHALRNTGDGPLAWLVIEVPATADPRKDLAMATSAVIPDLYDNGPVDASTVLTGALRTVRLARLLPADETRIGAEGAEHTVFVTDGGGTARAGGTTVPLAAGRSLTLPLGSAAELRAGSRGLEYFHAVLAVPHTAPAAEHTGREGGPE